MKKTPQDRLHQTQPIKQWLSWWQPTWITTALQQKIWASDIIAGLMMGVLVIPQSLGYAALAGLPPVMGLYAAIIPTLAYAYFGASSVQAVGPVAITAIMTASTLGTFENSGNIITLATTLALMIGAILILASWLRLGWIVQFISRGVSAGFISAAALLIVLGQTKGLLGVPLQGDSISAMIGSLIHAHTPYLHLPTATLGITALTLLLLSRYRGEQMWGWLPSKLMPFAGRLFVILLVAVAIFVSRHYHLESIIAATTPLPNALVLPTTLTLPTMDTLTTLLPSALLMAFIAFVSTAAISTTHAQQRHEHYLANKELLALGVANIASGLSGGFSVSGGISRTSLNVALGAKSPLASVVCALVILCILLFFADLLTGLPYAILSAIIITSAISMIDIQTLKNAYRYDKVDFFGFLASFLGVCFFGLNIGLIAGLLTSFAGLIYKSHRIHIAVVGQVGDSEHFRNILRYKTRTFDDLLLLRLDESLYFGNSGIAYATLMQLVYEHPKTKHIVLIMTAVNRVDLTAQEMLIRLNKTLAQQQKQLHYSEIKGPIMDTLVHTQVIKDLSGQVFLSTMMAVQTLTKQP